MKVLVIVAHPNRASFNHAIAQTCSTALTANGGEPTNGAPGVLLTPPTWYSMGHGPQLKNQMASYPFIRTLAAAPAAVGELCHTAVKSLCLIEL